MIAAVGAPRYPTTTSLRFFFGLLLFRLFDRFLRKPVGETEGRSVEVRTFGIAQFADLRPRQSPDVGLQRFRPVQSLVHRLVPLLPLLHFGPEAFLPHLAIA